MNRDLPPRPDVNLPRPLVVQLGATVELRLEGVSSPEPTRRVQVPTAAEWASRDEWLTAWQPPFDVIRGEEYRDEALEALTGPETATGYVVPVDVEMIREPSNAYDSNAIRVEIQGSHVGYIGRELAAVVAPILDGANTELCRYPGVILGGSYLDPSRQVYVWLDRRLSDGPDVEVPPELAYEPMWPPEEALSDEEAAELGLRRPPDLDRFAAIDAEIESAWKERDLARVESLTKESIPIIPSFAETKRADRAMLLKELRSWSNDTSMPDDYRASAAERLEHETSRPLTGHLNAVGYGAQVLAALGNRTALEQMRTVLVAEPDLSDFVAVVEHHLELADLIERILDQARASPGVIQKDLHAILPADKEDVRTACYLADMAGRLERTKRGASYALVAAQV